MLVEFAFVTAFLVVWLAFFMIFSRLVSQIIWVGQVSYQATLQGMLGTAGQREEAIFKIVAGSGGVPGAVELHQTRRNSPLDTAAFSLASDFLYTAPEDASPSIPGDSITVRLKARAPLSLSMAGVTSNYAPIEFVGPSLTSTTNFSELDDLSDFGNDLGHSSGNHWGCCAGSETAPTGSCASQIASDPAC